MKTMFMIAIGSVTCLLMMSCQPSRDFKDCCTKRPSSGNRQQRGRVIRYMSCLGLSTEAAAKAWRVTKGDANKVITIAHMAVSGDLSGETPPNKREKACLKRRGL